MNRVVVSSVNLNAVETSFSSEESSLSKACNQASNLIGRHRPWRLCSGTQRCDCRRRTQTLATHGLSKNLAAQAFLGFCRTPWNEPFEAVWLVVLVENASRVDDDGLAGHGLGAAHGDHHVGAVVLVGWPLQERARCGALDLFGPEIGRRASAVQQTRCHAVDERLRR